MNKVLKSLGMGAAMVLGSLLIVAVILSFLFLLIYLFGQLGNIGYGVGFVVGLILLAALGFYLEGDEIENNSRDSKEN